MSMKFEDIINLLPFIGKLILRFQSDSSFRSDVSTNTVRHSKYFVVVITIFVIVIVVIVVVVTVTVIDSGHSCLNTSRSML